MRTKDYFGCWKHTRTELILLLYISPFNSHLLSPRLCQDRSLMKHQCGGNALSICYYQPGNMTSTQDNMAHLRGRCSSCVSPYLYCNFTIPEASRNWRRMKHLDIASPLDRLSIPSPSKSMHEKWEFLEQQNGGWQRNMLVTSLHGIKQRLPGFPLGVTGDPQSGSKRGRA